MPLSQTIAFVRREVAEVLHQPLLVLVLVIGPFAVLLLFGVGYRNEPLILRTLVVAPDDAPIDAVLERFEDRLGDAITIEGATQDLVLATQRLQDGDVDLVVVVPPDPVATVLDGRQAEIVVLHEKLDPIQQVAVDFASRLATEEVNAVVLAEVVRRGQTALTSGESLDSAVLVRPFSATTELLTEEDIEIIDFFAPAAVALLVAHLGISVGALSFVRDERLGLMELYRAGPVGPWQTLAGKFIAYCILGGVAGGGLLVLVVRFLDVPSLGSVVHVVATVALVVGASVAIGLVLSLLAGSDSQAVQFSMLVLLASLFFSGFILDLERLRQPALAVSSVLPVTYGTRMLREAMLLGRAPAVTDYVGVAAVAVVS
ncbi:MAG: ABC transporter permease, partial [Acidimicrobiales bacterium]|nr:ABC transporter permease [Acidimicrobiales bacterium]